MHLSIITFMYFCSLGCFLIKVQKFVKFFVRCLFVIIWCHYVAILPPANRYIADCGFEYRSISPFKPTHEHAIDLSVSPSPRTQTSQWQSSISCTGSRTRTSLGFSSIEKHWKIGSSHRFYGVYGLKMENRCAWGTCNTDSRYPERMGNIIYFITFPESK